MMNCDLCDFAILGTCTKDDKIYCSKRNVLVDLNQENLPCGDWTEMERLLQEFKEEFTG